MATVEDLMTKDVLTVEPSDTIGEAAEKMDEANVGAVGVVEDRPSAEQRRQDASAIDVAHDHDRQTEAPGKTEVDVIAAPEVDLGGGSRDLPPRRVRASRPVLSYAA